MLAEVRTLKELCRVVVKIAVEDKVTVERTNAAEDSRLRLCRYSQVAQSGYKVLKVFEFDVKDLYAGPVEIAQKM